ncbi:hypothetical protein [Saccharothrix sp. ST-888]|uniref:hypothetical protein n=1 Tax=Saccharothrix sp. ST-888 TaxID=1427391 RepID=UPI0005ECAD0C|nr:hypothetical protein [Saccharothrix sp. ST-888]KJK55665.1 hypothetical protein UK12_27295 [Saccharothrix sp. ST-888]
MLQALGLNARTENVYRTLLAEPDGGFERIAAVLHLTEAQVREALDELLELTLLRPANDSHTLRAVSPEVGLTRLLAHNQNQLLFRQQQLENARPASIGTPCSSDVAVKTDVRCRPFSSRRAPRAGSRDSCR